MNNPQNDVRQGWTSASSAQADLLCPGRHLKSKSVSEPPEQGRDKDQAHGQAVHAALAAGKPDGLTPAQVETFDACVKIEKAVIAQVFGVDGWTPGLPARRLWFRNNGVQHSGEVDALHRRGIRALIFDRKTLYGDVPTAASNLQLRDYACLVYANAVLLEEIFVAVIQPKVTHTPELCVYSRADLERATAEMLERVMRSNDPNSPRRPGDEQCKFCRGKVACLEYGNWAKDLLPVSRLLPGSAIAEWTPEEMSGALQVIPSVESFIELIRNTARERLNKDPEAVPGYYLRPNRPIRIINNPQECANRFVALGGTIEQFMGSVNIGKEKLQEALVAATGLKGKALAQALASLSEGIVDETPKEPSLVRKKEEVKE